MKFDPIKPAPPVTRIAFSMNEKFAECYALRADFYSMTLGQPESNSNCKQKGRESRPESCTSNFVAVVRVCLKRYVDFSPPWVEHLPPGLGRGRWAFLWAV